MNRSSVILGDDFDAHGSKLPVLGRPSSGSDPYPPTSPAFPFAQGLSRYVLGASAPCFVYTEVTPSVGTWSRPAKDFQFLALRQTVGSSRAFEVTFSRVLCQ